MIDEVTLKEPIFLTRKTVADLCGISVRQVDRIRAKNLLQEEKYRCGNVVLFTADSVEDLQEYFDKKDWYRQGGENYEVED